MGIPLTCSKIISHRSSRSGQTITPTFAQLCQLPSDHQGPCSSPSDRRSTEARVKWEQEEKVREAKRRHQASGLGQYQSLPESVSARGPNGEMPPPHPASPVQCPFCDVRPAFRDLIAHTLSHASTSANEVVVEDAPPPPSSDAPGATEGPVKSSEPRPGTHEVSDQFMQSIEAVIAWVDSVVRLGFVLPPEVGDSLDVLRQKA